MYCFLTRPPTKCKVQVQYLVSVFELETGNDLALQFGVIRRLVQDVLTEFGNVCFARFPQHRIKPVI